MKFKDYLQKDIERIGCSLSELSKASGLSSAVLSRYRSGERAPRKDSELLVQLCNGITELEQKAGLASTVQNRLAIYKAALSDDYVLNYDRFDRLLKILHVSMKELSHELNYDASYLSRIRSGKRSPADPEQFAENVSEFFIRSARPEELEEIGEIVQENNLLHLQSALQNWLIRKREAENRPLEFFLKTLDEFNLEEFSRSMRFEDLQEIEPLVVNGYRTYYGIEQMRQAEYDFFRLAAQSSPESPLFMCNDMPLEEMAEDRNFTKKMMYLIAVCLKKGFFLNLVHDINRSFSEMMIGLQAWIPVYMTGQIRPYYLPNADSSIYHHCLYVCHDAVLSGECIHGSHHHGSYFLSSEKNFIQHGMERAGDILSLARPLMSIYRQPQLAEFDVFRDEEFNKPGDRTILSCVPPLASLTHDLLIEILRSASISEELYEPIEQARKKELADLNLSLRKGKMIMRLPELSEEEFKTYTPLLKLASMLQNIEVPYTWETYQKHIQLANDFAETTPGFELLYDQRSAFRNITIYVRDDELAMILKHKSPEIAFVITHPKMVNALQNFTAPIFEDD